MYKVIFPLMSFVTGMLCMSLVLSGSHTSTFAQAPTPVPSGPWIGARQDRGVDRTIPADSGSYSIFTRRRIFGADEVMARHSGFANASTCSYPV